MLVSTTFDIPGYEVTEHKGVVRGIIVRSPTISQGLMGGLQNIIGGKIAAYTKMCEQTREQAYQEMVNHAQALGANAVIGFRYDSSDVIVNSTEVLCYGTAVVVERESRF